jgi:hypothetical protein
MADFRGLFAGNGDSFTGIAESSEASGDGLRFRDVVLGLGGASFTCVLSGDVTGNTGPTVKELCATALDDRFRPFATLGANSSTGSSIAFFFGRSRLAVLEADGRALSMTVSDDVGSWMAPLEVLLRRLLRRVLIIAEGDINLSIGLQRLDLVANARENRR